MFLCVSLLHCCCYATMFHQHEIYRIWSDITVTNSLFSSWRSALWTQLPGHRVSILRATVGPGDRRDAVRAEWHVSLCGGKVYGRPPYKTSQRTSRRRDCSFVITSIMWFYNYTVFLNSWPRRSFIHVVVWWSISIYRLYLSVESNWSHASFFFIPRLSPFLPDPWCLCSMSCLEHWFY